MMNRVTNNNLYIITVLINNEQFYIYKLLGKVNNNQEDLVK